MELLQSIDFSQLPLRDSGVKTIVSNAGTDSNRCSTCSTCMVKTQRRCRQTTVNTLRLLDFELCAAIVSKQTNSIAKLLNRRQTLEQEPLTDLFGYTPLTFCCAIDDGSSSEETIKVLKVLLAYGCQINSRERRSASRNTPLLIACKQRQVTLVDFLLSHGASPNHKDLLTGESPLCIMLRCLKATNDEASKTKLEKIALLLLNSADIDLFSSSSSPCVSILKMAVTTSNLSIISQVIKRGHSTFDQKDIQESLDRLDETKLSLADKKLVHGMLHEELTPRPLQTLSGTAVYNHLRRRSSNVIAMLPCSNRLKCIIKSCSDYHTDSKSVAREKDMAMQYLRMF